MAEQFLFDMDHEPVTLLASLARQGFVFLTPKQVCSLLSKTWGQIRYAIQRYELDAYYIAGEYRFTIQAVQDFIDGVQEKSEEVYHSTIGRFELSGVYALIKGYSISNAVRAIGQKGYPVSIIDSLLEKDKTYRYNDMEEGTTEMFDFYDIPSLDIPERMYLWEFANMLQMDELKISRDLGLPLDYILSYPEAYDYLVSKQYVNGNVTQNSSGSQKYINEDEQLLLGF